MKERYEASPLRETASATINGKSENSGAECRCADEALQPLWLTPQEANLLLQLCLTSDLATGEEEHHLFRKLGEFLRAQSRLCVCRRNP